MALAYADKISDDYDAVIIAVPHEPYLSLDENYFSGITQSAWFNCGFKRYLQE